jgi:hypothetical protein
MSRLVQIAMYVLLFMLVLSIITVAINGGSEKPDDDPVDSPDTNVTTPTKPGNDTPKTYKQKLAERLQSSNITVLSTKTKDGTVTLRYVPAKPNKSVIVQEMGTIYLRYISLIQDGWKINQLEAKVVPPGNQTNNSSANKSRDAVATWYLKTKWVKNVDKKDISKKILQKIFDSIKVKGKDEQTDSSPIIDGHAIRPPVSFSTIRQHHRTGPFTARGT